MRRRYALVPDAWDKLLALDPSLRRFDAGDYSINCKELARRYGVGNPTITEFKRGRAALTIVTKEIFVSAGMDAGLTQAQAEDEFFDLSDLATDLADLKAVAA